MRFLSFVLASCALIACAPASSSSPDEASQSAESDLSSSKRGIAGHAMSGYYANQPNVGRELEESGVTNISGVLTFRHATSVYDFAAVVELTSWRIVSTNGFDPGPGSNRMFVIVDGAPAKKIFDAMTKATETKQGKTTIRKSAHGSVWCEDYATSQQCALGPFDDVGPR
jgi:hypothetical protein